MCERVMYDYVLGLCYCIPQEYQDISYNYIEMIRDVLFSAQGIA